MNNTIAWRIYEIYKLCIRMYILVIISIIIKRELLKQRRRHYSNDILYSCYQNALREVGPRLTFHLSRIKISEIKVSMYSRSCTHCNMYLLYTARRTTLHHGRRDDNNYYRFEHVLITVIYEHVTIARRLPRRVGYQRYNIIVAKVKNT